MQRVAKLVGRHRGLAIGVAAITTLAVGQLPWLRPAEGNQACWANIVWVPFAANGDTFPHAALMVDAQLQGLKSPAMMQLDLGIAQTVLYHHSDLNLGFKARVLHRFSGTVANRSFRNETFRFWGTGEQSASTAGPILIGSLGSSFFEDRILLLDFVKQRIAILGRGSQLPDELERTIEYLPIMRNRYGNLLIPTTINGRTIPNVMFDTGSSVLAMATGRANWMAWTKRQEHDSLNSVIRGGNSWGRTTTVIGAPLLGTLCVGHACAYRPIIFFESPALHNLGFEPGSMASAVVGNVLFDGQFTLVVDIAQRRIGLFRGSLTFKK